MESRPVGGCGLASPRDVANHWARWILGSERYAWPAPRDRGPHRLDCADHLGSIGRGCQRSAFHVPGGRSERRHVWRIRQTRSHFRREEFLRSSLGERGPSGDRAWNRGFDPRSSPRPSRRPSRSTTDSNHGPPGCGYHGRAVARPTWVSPLHNYDRRSVGGWHRVAGGGDPTRSSRRMARRNHRDRRIGVDDRRGRALLPVSYLYTRPLLLEQALPAVKQARVCGTISVTGPVHRRNAILSTLSALGRLPLTTFSPIQDGAWRQSGVILRVKRSSGPGGRKAPLPAPRQDGQTWVEIRTSAGRLFLTKACVRKGGALPGATTT